MSFIPETPELEVPDRIQGTFKRMLYRSPREIREDPTYQLKLLTFLKLGNESTARQFIAIQKIHLFEQLSLIKKHARDVVDPEAEVEEGVDVENGSLDEKGVSDSDPAVDPPEANNSDDTPEDNSGAPDDPIGPESSDAKDASIDTVSKESDTPDNPTDPNPSQTSDDSGDPQ